MGLFGSRKRQKQPQGKGHTIGDAAGDEGALEMFRVGALSSGMPLADARKLERAIFGRAFEELLDEGYVPSIAVKADDDGLWTALGKVPTDHAAKKTE